MATRDDLAADIANDIDDSTGEYSSEIVSAIQRAQRYCERMSFYFNQTRTITFATVASQTAYGASANANIPTLIEIQSAWCEDAGGERTPLTRVPFSTIEALTDNSASGGEPFNFAYFEQQVWLYPIPDSANYTIRLVCSNYRLGALTAGNSTNAWLDEAYDMLKERAKYELASDSLKDPDIAAAALGKFEDEKSALMGEAFRRLSTRRVKVRQF